MFYTRTELENENQVTYLVDPLQDPGSGKANWYNVASLEPPIDGMYWIKKSSAGNVDLNGLTIALTEDELKVIRIGSLCRMKNISYRIENVQKDNWAANATSGTVK